MLGPQFNNDWVSAWQSVIVFKQTATFEPEQRTRDTEEKPVIEPAVGARIISALPVGIGLYIIARVSRRQIAGRDGHSHLRISLV
jgi:hypothetical protein